MKKHLFLLMILLFSQMVFAYPKQKPFPPFRIIGNLYYVGTDDLASYLIVTPKGNILINSNLETDVPMLKSNIEKLGFRFTDTKILLVSHAHQDHVEGSQKIKKLTHAKYMVMAPDVLNIESGGRDDFQYGDDKKLRYPKSTVDKVLHDGDEIELGGMSLKAHLTPGHTKGNTTWSMIVTHNNEPFYVVIVGSVNVNPGYQLVNNKKYPNIANDFKKSFAKLKSLTCDIFLGSHASQFDLQKKYQLMQQGNEYSFVDLKGYQDHIALKEREFYSILKQQGS